MDESTIIPSPIPSARILIKFMLMSKRAINIKVSSTVIGIDTPIIAVAPKFRSRAKRTITTKIPPYTTLSCKLPIESFTKSDCTIVSSIVKPLLRPSFFILSNSARTALVISACVTSFVHWN